MISGLILVSCGQQDIAPAEGSALDSSGQVPEAYRDQSGAAWTYAAPAGELRSQGVLSDLSSWSSVLSATSGWGPIEINMSNGEKAARDGRPLTMGGAVYPSGLGLHAGAEIRYSGTQATGQSCLFSADVGIDDEVGNRGSVVFQAYADGIKVYDSGVLKGSDAAAKRVLFAFPSAKVLSVVVNDAGDNNYFDHVDIANPMFACAPGAPMTLDQSALSVYHLHSGTLRATFHPALSGTVKLRLVADPILNSPVALGGRREAPPLVLDTTTLSLSGGQSQVRELKISAPNTIDRFSTDDTDSFRLIASVGGTDIATASVNLTELPLKITSQLLPGTVSGRVGDLIQMTLLTTVDPPLPAAVQMKPFVVYRDAGNLSSVGVTTGTGGAMKTPVTFMVSPTFGFYFPGQSPVTIPQTVAVEMPGITTGYRDHFYGADGTTMLTVTVKP
jgi:NPCBM/NEW2 domain